MVFLTAASLDPAQPERGADGTGVA